jgi:DNA invertase Pin-like site-specific DNA recombinase
VTPCDADKADRCGGRKIGYARVSTEDQNADLQWRALREEGCDVIHSDNGCSGNSDRPGLEQALAAVEPGDTIIVWRLDRLGRWLIGMIETVTTLEARGVHFKSLCEMVETGTASGRFLFHMLGAMAEYERALLSERTRAGLASARARGERLGRPSKLTMADLRWARARIDGGESLNATARTLGVDRTTLRRRLTAEGM